jgi:hypothetical protein
VYGTALSLTCSGLTVYALSRYLNVSSLREFGDLMRIQVPKHTEALPEYVTPFRASLHALVAKVVPASVLQSNL